MLYPNHFQINETWVAFKLNELPIATEADGDFNLVALMDAGSCFMLGSLLVPVRAGEPSAEEARRLLDEGQAHKQALAKTLLISRDQPATALEDEARHRGMTVAHVAEHELVGIVGEARAGFREHVRRGRRG